MTTLISAEATKKFYFRPVCRSLRGAIDFSVPKTAAEFKLQQRWGALKIPGEVLNVDLGTGRSFLSDPLYSPEYADVRKRLEQQFRLPPERVDVSESPSTLLYWMNHSILAGKMKLLAGQIPPIDSLPEKPRIDFIITPRTNERDAMMMDVLTRLGRAVEANTKLLNSLVTKLSK